AGLLEALFAQGVALVTTGNTAPASLYRDGLQRARFLPAIALIEARCRVLELVSAHDWRRRALQQAPIYQTPLGGAAEQALARIFADYAHGPLIDGGHIDVEGRPIAVKRRADNIAWFDFDALCDGPRAVADYLEIARRYPAVMISNVPQFSPDSDDPAKRFVRLVDAFYDQRVKLIVSAATTAVELYDGEKLRAEFARTASRLIEMMSRDYLDLPHA
ncbi:MAG TPA: cell division protein ZapE, partial [Rhodanobacteraceae bacterium]|nr:cell division protein ZapE [Rhodanobacteraceae bacterium]